MIVINYYHIKKKLFIKNIFDTKQNYNKEQFRNNEDENGWVVKNFTLQDSMNETHTA